VARDLHRVYLPHIYLEFTVLFCSVPAASPLARMLADFRRSSLSTLFPCCARAVPLLGLFRRRSSLRDSGRGLFVLFAQLFFG